FDAHARSFLRSHIRRRQSRVRRFRGRTSIWRVQRCRGASVTAQYDMGYREVAVVRGMGRVVPNESQIFGNSGIDATGSGFFTGWDRLPAEPGRSSGAVRRGEPPHSLLQLKLLDGDRRASGLEGSLGLLGGFLVGLLQERLGSAVNQVLGLCQTEAREGT